jgi:hypothetical protein
VVKKFELGKMAIEYVRENLLHGLTLSQRLSRVVLGGGQVFAFLPEEASMEAAARFDIGGLTGAGAVAEIERAVSLVISSHLSGRGSPYAIFEDCCPRPADGSLRGPGRPLFFSCGEEVYYFVPPGESDPSKIVATMRSVSSWTFNAVLTHGANLPALEDWADLSPDLLSRYAEGVVHILVGAYDREGYLLWTRRRAN